MSKMVKLSAALPGDEQNNGMDEYVDELIKNPRTIVAAVVMLDVPQIIDDTESGTRVPTIRIRRIEPLGPAKDVDPKFVKLFQTLVEQRTGAAPLPFGADFEVEAGDDQ